MKVLIGLIVVIFTFSLTSAAQSDTTKTKKLSVITKIDGTQYVGEILSDDGREVLIVTEQLGKIYIPKSEIKSIEKITSVDSIVHGEYRSSGPFTTRYAFTTNALPIKKGENYAIINLYGPEVHFAISDNFNLGVMSTWIASPFILAGKYSIKSRNEKLNFSIGSLVGTSGYLNNFRGFGGLHFANITAGSRERNFTFSAGYAYVQAGFKDGGIPPEGKYFSQDSYFYNEQYEVGGSRLVHGPIVSIAGVSQVGKKASFIFDSMIGLFPINSYNVSTTELTAPYSNPNPPYDYTPGTYEHQVLHVKSYAVAMFIMPGMRFQSVENRAFQISLAGITYFKEGDFLAVPIPMCSWYFKF